MSGVPPHARFADDDTFADEPWIDAEVSGDVRRGALGRRSRTGPARQPSPAGIVRLDGVQPEAVDWLWPGRLPAGMVAVLDGDPGCGKSTVTIDLAARLTTGTPFPGDNRRRRPVDVMLLGHEDSPAHTIRPRLDASGADVSRVHLLQDIDGHWPEFPGDADAIEQAIRDTGSRLLVIDPISAYIGKSDLHRDNEVRAALAPLATIAERTGAAVLMLRHNRKSGGTSAIHRGLGSVAITGIARAGLMLLQDPDDDTARILAWHKMSVAPVPKSLRWRWDVREGAPRIAWGGECELSADDILSQRDRELRDGGGERVRAEESAGQWLRQRLRDGVSVPVKTLVEESAEAGIKERTLMRARSAFGAAIAVSKIGGASGRWEWRWTGSKGAKDSQGERKLAPLAPFEPPPSLTRVNNAKDAKNHTSGGLAPFEARPQRDGAPSRAAGLPGSLAPFPGPASPPADGHHYVPARSRRRGGTNVAGGGHREQADDAPADPGSNEVPL